MTIYYAAAGDPPRSWAGIVALLVAYGLFLFFAPLLQKIGKSSPTRALPRGHRVKVQSTVGVTDDEPGDTEVGWWGRIVEIGGVRYRQAKQIMATGSPELPPVGEGDDIDVPLDDDPGDDEDDESAMEYIARARGLKVPYNHIVRVVMDHYGLSESTAKRRIREVDEQDRGPAAAA